MIKKIISDRNIFLVIAVIAGIFLPEFSKYIKEFITIILGIVMTFSLSAISTSSLFPLKRIIKPFVIGITLNYIIFGIFILIAAFLFKDNEDIFYGLIIIAATPPGVAIIPFTYKLNGDLNTSIIGTFAAFIASIFLAPLIIGIFSKDAGINSLEIFKLMVFLIIIPFIISRLLIIDKLVTYVKKIRGSIVDFGFTIIIYTSVGLNNQVFFTDYLMLIKISVIFFIIMAGIGMIYSVIMKNKITHEEIISHKLLFAIKSSGFAVVTSIDIFGIKSALPATIMSVCVLVYLLTLVLLKKK